MYTNVDPMIDMEETVRVLDPNFSSDRIVEDGGYLDLATLPRNERH